ncbi:MAG: hypothetical protein ACPGJF_07625 [Sinimarinibacterium flocculans]|uniref:hypothetical protein n=1 Tax=Sinimarinibacterium flocculans TaxID=985250 RepID=UPI003C4C6E6E
MGDVHHLYFEVLRGKAKHKFCALVCAEAPLRFALINTENQADVLDNPALRPCQVQIKSDDYDFLSHDSWIDLHEFAAIPRTVDQIAAEIDAGAYRGTLSTEDLIKVIRGIEASVTLVKKQADRALQELRAELSRRLQTKSE